MIQCNCVFASLRHRIAWQHVQENVESEEEDEVESSEDDSEEGDAPKQGWGKDGIKRSTSLLPAIIPVNIAFVLVLLPLGLTLSSPCSSFHAGVWNVQSYVDRKRVIVTLPESDTAIPVRVDLCKSKFICIVWRPCSRASSLCGLCVYV